MFPRSDVVDSSCASYGYWLARWRTAVSLCTATNCSYWSTSKVAWAESWTRHMMTAAISTGLPSLSLTLILSPLSERTRNEIRRLVMSGFVHHQPASRTLPL